MTHDPNKLTPTEVHAMASLLAAVQGERDEDAKWWSRRPEVISALAKMRAQTRSSQS